jgi:hypothetical protein
MQAWKELAKKPEWRRQIVRRLYKSEDNIVAGFKENVE